VPLLLLMTLLVPLLLVSLLLVSGRSTRAAGCSSPPSAA
jgi:hypothetical protein